MRSYLCVNPKISHSQSPFLCREPCRKLRRNSGMGEQLEETRPIPFLIRVFSIDKDCDKARDKDPKGRLT